MVGGKYVLRPPYGECVGYFDSIDDAKAAKVEIEEIAVDFLNRNSKVISELNYEYDRDSLEFALANGVRLPRTEEFIREKLGKDNFRLDRESLHWRMRNGVDCPTRLLTGFSYYKDSGKLTFNDDKELWVYENIIKTAFVDNFDSSRATNIKKVRERISKYSIDRITVYKEY